MKYLLLCADQPPIGLSDRYSESGYCYLTPEDLGLSNELATHLRQWLRDYDRFRGASDFTNDERREILNLDLEAMALIKRIIEEVGGAKIEYFSYGLSRRVFTENEIISLIQEYGES